MCVFLRIDNSYPVCAFNPRVIWCQIKLYIAGVVSWVWTITLDRFVCRALFHQSPSATSGNPDCTKCLMLLYLWFSKSLAAPTMQYAVQPPTFVHVIGNPTTPTRHGSPHMCALCDVGILKNGYPFCAWLLCICCFPIGFLCCIPMRRKKCSNCGVTYWEMLKSEFCSIYKYISLVPQLKKNVWFYFIFQRIQLKRTKFTALLFEKVKF